MGRLLLGRSGAVTGWGTAGPLGLQLTQETPQATAAPPSVPRYTPPPCSSLDPLLHTVAPPYAHCSQHIPSSLSYISCPQHTQSSLYQRCLSHMPHAPQHHTSCPPPCFSFACTHFGTLPMTQSHHKLCSRLTLTSAMSTECIGRLLEICGHSSTQGAP